MWGPRGVRRGVGIVIGALLVLLSASPADSLGEQPVRRRLKGFAPAGSPQPVRVELIAEHASVQRGGTTRIGVSFDVEEGWHIYAKEPGDAGLPTTIQWVVPHGIRVGALQWPTPQEFLDPGNIRTFGYAGAVVLSSPLTTSSQAVALHTVPIHAQVEWLACKALCVPGSAELDLVLPISTTPPFFSPHAQLFEQSNE